MNLLLIFIFIFLCNYFLIGVNGFADYAIKINAPNNHIMAGYDWGFELHLDTSILNPSRYQKKKKKLKKRQILNITIVRP